MTADARRIPANPIPDHMQELCLVRQPVFEAVGTLLGYEIRFRDNERGRLAFAQSLLSGTFDTIRGDLPAFLACTREQLLQDAIEIVDPRNAILLLPADLQVDDDVRSVVARYCESGGKIALDNLDDQPAPVEELLSYASWARVDVRCGESPEIKNVCNRLVRTGSSEKPRLIADHVYDNAQFDTAQEIGFHAYQGSFFSRPEPLPAADLPPSSISAIRLLGMSRDPRIGDKELEEVLATDPVLTFQLLRLVNSAALGARGLTSIGQAIRVIGRTSLQRWLAIAVAASRRSESGIDQELVRQAIERARFLEQMSSSVRDSGTLFLVGLFSMLDAVFRMPLPELLQRVTLSDEATRALLERQGPYADAISFAESYEMGLFEHAAEIAEGMGVDSSRLGEFYMQAVEWTHGALSTSMAKAA